MQSVMIKNKELSIPIIQGGMGVGVSLSRLAGSVMKQGCMGVISAAHPGYQDECFEQNNHQANLKAIKLEANKARAIADGKGLLAINIMCASKHYQEYVEASVEAGYDAIISGAGLPLSLPEYVKDENIALGVIVSSAKALTLIHRRWQKNYQRLPDFIIIESHLAGGHLGFKKQELENDTCASLKDILLDVLAIEEVKNNHIPVFVAGGIYDHNDIEYYISLGASGVQMGTRFITTYECDASAAFKQAIVQANQEDIVYVDSPTGLVGRALNNAFVQKKKQEGKQAIQRCYGCLKMCNPKETPYCISQALIQAVKGNLDEGLIFVGANAHRIQEIISVEQLIKELTQKEV